MAFRTIVIGKRSKLECSLNYLICRKGDQETKVLLDEINIMIIDSCQVSITSALLSACIEKKIKVIFTDSSHQPCGELVGYHNSFYSYRKLKEQMTFEEFNKGHLWERIVVEKIVNQAKNLKDLKKYEQLMEYADQVEFDDSTNREGHAAKVYFNSLFGNDFNRRTDCSINKFLNYGYSIMMSSISKEISSCGYLTELGIHHIGESNSFNLSCDFVEPLRPLVDYQVINGKVNENNYKIVFLELLNKNVIYNERNVILANAIHLYVEDLFNYLKSGNEEKIKFIKYEL